MKILVKTDKGLKKLGEGKIFSKNQLMLREMGIQGQDATVQIDATSPYAAKQIDDLVKNTPLQDRQNYRVKIVNGQQSNSNKIDNAHTGSLVGATNGSNAITQSRQACAENPSLGGTSCSLDDINPKENGSINSSVMPRKVMDEMRVNSIPFTKKELHKFLMDL